MEDKEKQQRMGKMSWLEEKLRKPMNKITYTSITSHIETTAILLKSLPLPESRLDVKAEQRCLIIKYQQTSKEFSDENLQMIKDVFKDIFKFIIYEESPKDINELKRILRKEANRIYEFLIIFVITDKTFDYSINDLLKYFAYKMSNGRKPKFLFLLGPENVEFQVSTASQSNKTTFADLVLFYSKQISSTIHSICSILKENASKKYDFITMLKMASHQLQNCQNMPIIMSTLTTATFLNPNPEGNVDNQLKPHFYPDIQYRISNGLCVIYHNKTIGTKVREQTEYDVNLLKATFGELNYDVTEKKDLSKADILAELDNDSKFSDYDFLILSFSSQGLSGQIICSDQNLLDIKELVDKLRNNKSLIGKPKLVLVHTSQMLDSSQSDKKFQFEMCPDLIISYGAFTEQSVYHTSNKGGWFIYTLCNALLNEGKNELLDIETIATNVANTIEKNFEEHNLIPLNDIYQNPYFCSTLTRPLFIKEIEPDKRRQRHKGRCVILNYQNYHTINTTNLAASFVDIDFYCKTYYDLGYDKVKGILNEELEKVANQHNCFVLCIYANCYNQGFKCCNELIKFEDLFQYIQTLPVDKPVYIFINTNLSKRCEQSSYSYQQVGSITLSYNSHYLVNRVASTLLKNNCADKEEIFLEMTQNFASLQNVNQLFNRIKLACLTNTNDTFEILSTDADLDSAIYIKDRAKRNRCLVLNLNDNISRKSQIDNLISNSLSKTFKDGLDFDFEIRNEMQKLLDQKIDNFQNYNCFVLFIFFKYSTNEIKQINSFLDNYYENYYEAAKVPIIIFIQNLSNNKLEDFNQFENHNDLLLASIADDFTFIPKLCQLLDKHSSEYDLMSIVHMSNAATPLAKTKSIFLKSTLNKMLFLKICNIEFIKSDALFYQNANTLNDEIGKCMVLSNGQNDTEQLVKTFRKLKFGIVQENYSNVDCHQLLSKNGVLHNRKSICICIFVLLDGKSDAVILKQLIEELSNVKALFGKPKLLFLLGSIELASVHHLESDSNSANVYRIPKYADFMLFQSKHVSVSIQTICNLINRVNYVDQYDLISLLTMVIREMDQHILPADSEELKPIGASINSTLTRLFSFGQIIDTKVTIESKIADSYILPTENRGKCIIFNYENFSNPDVEPRIGTEFDKKLLEQTFESFKFKVEIHKDLTKEKTKYEIDQIDCSEFYCLVVCFLTHGNENELHCKDGKIRRDEVINSIACNKTLKNGMPKILIFQACRGEKHDLGINLDFIETDLIINTPDSPMAKYPDLFVLCSSYEGYLSYRIPKEGSLFIQNLCKELTKNNENATDKDFVTISTIACRVVSQISKTFLFIDVTNHKTEEKIVKQMPIFYSTLKKSLYF